jgi:hypothetical protein
MIENNRALSVVPRILRSRDYGVKPGRTGAFARRLRCVSHTTVATLSAFDRTIHRICGQLCGQLVVQRVRVAKLLGWA